MFTTARISRSYLTSLVGAALLLAVPVSAEAGKVKFSSELGETEQGEHVAAMAFDGQLQTSWAEGKSEGDTWLELSLDRTTKVESVSIWPGNIVQGKRSLKECGRPTLVTVTLLGGAEEVSAQERLPDLVKTGPRRVDIPVVGDARAIRITVDEAMEGYVFTHTYIAEVAVNFAAGDAHSSIEKLQAWSEGTSAVKAEQSARSEVIANFEKISSAEFGDREALALIMDYAGDGAPYMRDRVNRTVPIGYRAQALPPHGVAVEAILKLKDANAIPALEMASLRLLGSEAALINKKVEMFYAHQDFMSGGRRNITAWGESGWERGALRGFDEPLAIQADRVGKVYVADLGNHRVQQFGDNGVVEKLWGGDAGITNKWLEGERDYYPSGAMPGAGPGQFSLPVDIAIVPDKKEDGFVTLDASGRVQRFSSDGQPLVSWKVRSRHDLDSGVGGQGYIEYSKDKIVVLWTYEAFVYTLDGEELAAWEIEDGVPNGSVALKNGKLGLIYGPAMITYSLDGFRHGNLVGDELGFGFEAWDATLDQDGKLWAVTDNGFVVKYKKPGKKVDFSLTITDYSLIQPRIAVYDDVVYVTDRDGVIAVDTLEMKAQQELEAEEAAAQ